MSKFIAWLKSQFTPRTTEEIPMSEPLTPTDSTPAPTVIDATTGQIIKPTVIQTIVADAEAVVAKIESELSSIIIPHIPLATSTATPAVITKVGELLALSGRTPVAYAEITALALASAVTDDVDAVLAKLKDLVSYSGTKTDVWDQVVAVAKAL